MTGTQLTLDSVARSSGWDSKLAEPDAAEAERMRAGEAVLERALADNEQVYGVTRGFGPLVAYPASESSQDQGSSLIAHLGTAQGPSLPPELCRTVMWLRLVSMKQGYSAISPEFWSRLADLWNRGFTPSIPRDGTVSASGDLQPLASAALALAGQGEAWVNDRGPWRLVPSAEALRDLGADPVAWSARQALSFVNGSGVCLAVTIDNHRQLRRMVHAAAALTARAADLLGASHQAYHRGIGRARGQLGQQTVAGWIRRGLNGTGAPGAGRPTQEPYSLRCAPQVLGAVLDQLDATETILGREAAGCTDNPVCFEGEVLHGGNFHALPVGLCSDQLALCLQQVAFLADRQLALLCSPETNGGLPPMLTPRPGAASGLAGVQLSATSFVSRIRQMSYPSSLTALPCNNGNQDHVPMALNGANAMSDALEQGWNVIGSMGVGVAQLAALTGQPSEGSPWGLLAEASPPLDADRPLAGEVRACAEILRAHADELCEAESGEARASR